MSVLESPLVFVDIETTGMSYSRGRVIEVAAIRVQNRQITGSFSSLIDPQAELPMFISELTGIKRADLAGAPTFYDIADELFNLVKDAVFVAHNVRFDYGFLKREFRRIGKTFDPKQLCTVKLSKALYPSERGHKLQNLIDRCHLQVEQRHRAYDDASAMWQFIQHVEQNFPAPSIESAIKQQLKTPSLPRNLPAELIRNLPESPGVYIFQNEAGSPLYIGKSINIKKRVMSHFSADHQSEGEFKISQQVSDIETIVTGGELEALLLESKLIKDLQPLYNRQLRRRQKLTLARQAINKDGYIGVNIEATEAIDPENLQDILGVYTTKGKARLFLDQIIKDFGLCPKLMGLEKGPGSCFSYQIKRCSGGCVGEETPEVYNKRLLSVFEGRRLAEWPYRSAVLIEEASGQPVSSCILVDQWCVVANVEQQPDCEPQIKFQDKMFDIDTYKILKSYLTHKPHQLKIKPMSISQLSALAQS
jgi:DNA polymerase III subunit epsilon